MASHSFTSSAGAVFPPLDHPMAHSMRLATTADVAALKALHEVSMGTLGVRCYSPEEVAGLLSTHDTTAPDIVAAGRMLVVEKAPVLIASCGWRPDPENADTAEIRAVYVHPAWTGKGLASHLVQMAERQAAREGIRRFRLFSTLSAHRVYRQLGYHDVRTCDLPVGDGVWFRVIEMVRSLENAGSQAAWAARQTDMPCAV